MNNYYVLEIQTNADGTSGVLPFGYADKVDAEDKYLAVRQFANKSQVMVHTVLFIDNKGNNVRPPVSYIHPVPETPVEGEE